VGTASSSAGSYCWGPDKHRRDPLTLRPGSRFGAAVELGSQSVVRFGTLGLVGFLRGRPTNHDTPLTLPLTRSNPVRPRAR